MKGKKKIGMMIAIILTLSNLLSFHSVKAAIDTNRFVISMDGVLTKYNGNEINVTVPDSVIRIGPEAFKNCTSIKQIILPNGITEIGNGAFMGCSMLTELSLPSTLLSFSSNYIEGCNKLREITIPISVLSMQWDYVQNNGLERVNVDAENGVFSSIDGIVFNKAGTQLLHYPQNRKDNTYNLPKSVTDISQADFNRAKHLKNLTFNAKVTRTIKENGYADVDGRSFLNGTLESITVPKENETFCDINGVLFTKDKKVLIAYPEKRAGKAYIIPSGTKTIGSGAFSKSSDTVMNLRSILVPASVTEIQPEVACVIHQGGIGHNLDISLFGKKGSIVETYTRELEDINFDIKYGNYNSAKKGEQVLINATDLALGIKGVYYLESVVVPLSSNQTVTYKSSNDKVASVTVDGVIIANGLGEATITAKSKTGKSVSCTVSVKLPAPFIRFESTSSTTIKIAWDKITNAESYTIYRKSSIDAYEKLATVTTCSFIDKSLPQAYLCNYKVVANHKNPQYNSEKSIMIQTLIPE